MGALPDTASGVPEQQAENYYDAFDAIYRESWGLCLHHGWFEQGRGGGRPAVALARFQEEIVRRLKLAEGARHALCDVGCGYGVFSADLVRRSLVDRAVGITDARAQVEHALRVLPRLPNFRIVERDWRANRLPAQSFDRVTAIESLYHFPGEDKSQAIREISRVLCPGGRAVVTLWLRREDSIVSSSVDRGMSAWGCGFGSLAMEPDYRQWFAEHDLSVGAFDDVTRYVLPTIPELTRRVLAALWTEPAAFLQIFRSPGSVVRPGVALAFTWLGYSSGCLRYVIVELHKRH